MTRHLITSLAVLPLLASCLLACEKKAAAEPVKITRHTEWVYGEAAPSCDAASSETRVIRKTVQQTPQYDVSRPEVPSGATITLYANFLGSEPGYVMFHLNGTSTQCEVVDWKDNSVTAVLPRLGLAGPKNAEIQLVRPDGRIVKTFRVLFVCQPDLLVHGDTVPQPLPPAQAAGVTYAQ